MAFLPAMRIVFLIAALIGLSTAAGWTIRDAQTQPHLLSGIAYGGDGQVSIEGPDGVHYAVPVDTVTWIDAQGSMHGSGPPTCVPGVGEMRPMRFASVDWTLGFVGSRAVVWVDCR